MTNKKKVILTEDDSAIQDAIKMILQSAGYAVTVFLNGDNLVKGNYDIPDLFILDKQLSGVDGLDVCSLIKSKPDTAKVPIIIISASPQVAPAAFKAGANAFLEKPFKRREMLELVNGLIT